MFYATAAKSFSLREIFLNYQETGHEHDTGDSILVSTENLNRYSSSFPREVVDSVQKQLPTLEKYLIEAGMTLTPHPRTENADNLEPITSNVEISSFDRGWAIVTYRVTFGRVTTEVVMLNVAHRAKRAGRRLVSTGSFGQILEVSSPSGNYVYKRFYFDRNHHILSFGKDGMNWEMEANANRIREIIKQCALNKICSALKIAPQSLSIKSFDVICYENAIQFSMEKCLSLSSTIKCLESFKSRMLYCLRVLHSFNIIHKDIKPENLAYSPSLSGFVLLDFGISEWVQERPGQKSETYREGTFQFMSPQMKRLYPGGRGLVDLYQNDIYALLRSVEVINTKAVEQDDNSIFVETNSIEDELFPALWQLHFHGIPLPQELLRKIESRQIMDVLKYFPELDAIQHGARQTHQKTVPYNVQFIVRVNSLTFKLIRHLLPFVKQKRVEVLVCKLKERCLRQQPENPGSMAITPARIVNLTKLLELYSSLLRDYESNPSQDEEDLMEQIAILLLKFDIQLSRSDANRQCISALIKVAKLEKKLSSRQNWVVYIKWLVKLLQAPGELPNNTELLFRRPIRANLKYLLIKCVIVMYFRGHYQAAAGLCRYLCSPPKTEVPTDERRQVIQTFEHLLQQTNVHSEAWLVLAGFVWFQLIKTNQLDHFLNRYAKLAGSVQKDALSELLCMMAWAYDRQQKFQLAFDCCTRSLAIRQTQQLVDEDMLLRQSILLIDLYRKNGDVDSALKVYQNFLQRSGSFEEEVRLKQEMTVCLLRTQRQNQALQIFQQLEKSIVRLTRYSLTRFCELMSHHLYLIRQLKPLREDEKGIDGLTASILGSLDEVGDFQLNLAVVEKKVEMLLALATVQFAYERRQTAERIFKRMQAILVSYAWQLLFKEIPKQQDILKCVQELKDSLLVGSSKIGKLIYQRPLSAYFYASQLGRIYANSSLQQLSYLQQKYSMKLVCNTVDENKNIRVYLQYVCFAMVDLGRNEAALWVLETHQSISRRDQGFLEGCLLFKLGKLERSKEILSFMVKREHIPAQRRAYAHQKLSQIHKTLHNLGKAHQNQSQALVYFRRSYEVSPTDKNVWLSIGVAEMRLNNNKEALLWLERLQRNPKGLNKQQVRVVLVAYGTCLNQLGRCKQSMHYLKQAPTIDSGSQVERLFYLAHNCYILKRWRDLTKYSAGLLAADCSKENIVTLMNFLHGKGQLRRFQMMTVIANNTDAGQIVEECYTNARKLTEALIIAKRTYRFNGIFLRRGHQQPSKDTQHSRLLTRIDTFRKMILK